MFYRSAVSSEPGAPAQIDLSAAEKAAGELLTALGIPHDSGPLAGTPGRIARAYAELLTPREFSMTTFPNDEGYDEMVIARDIPFTSLCEHHLLPFIGTAVVAYLPGDRILGLSKLARVVEQFARRPQVQERMSTQIARWLDEELSPKGVGIVLRAEHTCMTVRGVKKPGTSTVTTRFLGSFRDNPDDQMRFMMLVGAADRVKAR